MKIKKYYLLAVLGMATNMIVMNEVNAMNQQNIDELDRCKYLGFPLNWENTFNLVGGGLFILLTVFITSTKINQVFTSTGGVVVGTQNLSQKDIYNFVLILI